MNPNKMLKQVRQMQSQMMQMQEKLASETVEASVGGGMVSATFSGQGDIVSIKIDPEVINPDDKEMLEDLIVSAVNEGLKKSRDLINDRMSSITGGLGGALGSLGL
ncbi:MAG: YbaB/EbfC family nucleoid-associated protein [Synergistaceae bacterium]|nr:YbaB/EbfC family nucleoid-associated protein [Synergistaceae bacterium]